MMLYIPFAALQTALSTKLCQHITNLFFHLCFVGHIIVCKVEMSFSAKEEQCLCTAHMLEIRSEMVGVQ